MVQKNKMAAIFTALIRMMDGFLDVVSLIITLSCHPTKIDRRVYDDLY